MRVKKKRVFVIVFLVLCFASLGTYYLLIDKDSNHASGRRELVVMSPNSQNILTRTIPSFEEKYGIKVRLIQGGTGQLIDRLEHQRKPLEADVFFGGNYTQFETHKDLFEPYVSKNVDYVISDYVHPSDMATPYTVNGSVLIVNNELARSIPISSYDDLLRPELKGKIAFADPNTSSSAFSQLTNILLAKGGYTNPSAWTYVKKLLANINAIKSSSSAEVYQSVAAGKMVVGLTYEDPSVNLLRSGANISIVYPTEGTVFVPSSVAIIKHSKAKKDAKRFINYMLSLEVQNAFAKSTTNRPIRRDAQSNLEMKPLKDITTLKEDYRYVTNHKEELLAKYNRLRDASER
ncbi:iron ABC transporter substrate-binding protein [Streptococcus phocae]|uniref:Iron ABC transporter substrate-binding protein n=1 Tax=Streptococcus phocae TaxID=119224 RepID=A0A0P6S0Z2_9STRE|nr:extracellular solute-binding protein [Streptococcus phocae]KPJ22084.1 iron ABC transporter substrate-binding protein [Streptococcus phocae]